MYFTRTDDTFRGWFHVVNLAGSIVPGLLPAYFTTTVVDSTDTTSTTLVVTESVQLPGLYYFNVPFSFLSSSGVGEYAVSVQIAAPAPIRIFDAFSEVLRVSEEDFDTIAGSITGSIAGAVWDELNDSHLLSGSTGKQLRDIANHVTEIYQIMGLELGSPMTVTTISRVVAAISQSISGDPTSSVTVTRLP